MSSATPLYFIANEGQVNAKALFYARTPGYALWLTREGLVFDRTERTEKGEATRSFSTMTFVGANKSIEVAAADPSDYVVSYFIGRDEADWKTGIATSKAVVYKNIYDGIDLRVYGTEKQIEYDWIVAPGADPETIRIAYAGPDQAKLDADGNLVVGTAAGQIVQRKPVSHQVVDGRKVDVASAFRPLPDGSYGFALGAYNPRHTLTIDPLVHAYSTYLGGQKVEDRISIAVDKAGAIYVRGYTESGDFPPYWGGQPRKDTFVTKLSPDGSNLIYTAFFPGSEIGYFTRALYVDDKGFVYLAGVTSSNKFPVKNAFQPSYVGKGDGFILKLSKDGRSLVYSSYIGGSSQDCCVSVVADLTGAAYIAGITNSRNFPTRKAFRPKNSGYIDGFVAKVSPKGSNLIYSTYLGGYLNDQCDGLAVDAKGCAVVVGLTMSANFPVKSAFQITHGGGALDGFIAKLNATGNGLVYSSFFGGSGSDRITDIAMDKDGAPYVTGYTSGKIPVRGGFQSERKGKEDGFVAKIASNGRSLVYSSYLGGRGQELPWCIAVDGKGAAYVVGYTYSADFPVKQPFQAKLLGSADAFLTVVDPTGAKLIYSTFLGGINRELGCGIALGNDGAIYLAGITNSPDLPMPSTGAYQGALAGDFDAFVFKFGQSGSNLERD